MESSKALLNTYCENRHLQPPSYSTERKEGLVGYTSSVVVCGCSFDSQARHSSPSLAEEDAARVAYNSLRRHSESQLNSRSAGYGSAASSTTRTDKSANGINANGTANYSQKLEKLCNARGLPSPEYEVNESDGKFICKVKISDNGEYLSGNSESYAQAKDYASLVALAEIGLSLLNINKRDYGEEDRCGPVSHYTPPPVMQSTQARDIELPEKNYKAMVNEYCQKNYLPLPEYVTEYPDDSTGFVSVLTVCGKEYQSKPRGSKKKAEQNVAGIAAFDIGLVKINDRERGEGPVNGRESSLCDRFPDRATVPERAEEYLERSEPVSHYTPPPVMQSTRARDIELPEKNYKAMVNEYCQKNYQPLPEYVTEYPDDSTGFVSVLTVCGKEYQSKPHGSKKKAEQNVAGIAALDIGLVKINEKEGGEAPVNSRGSSVTSSLSTSSLGGLSGSLDSRFSDRRAAVSENITSNYKGKLQEFWAKRGSNPEYSTEVGCGGFVSTVTLTDYSGETTHFQGNGHPNKKSAEQSAAKKACISYDLE